ncbi:MULTISPECIES: hypothetical protein [unclassified Micromonospora]|uniref:hypothetical protein n=1 Tax=unclassified Micromonospora TaxID=2617518 RepID=UPI001E340C37|nr:MULTISPECIES: hypothetical protein [unclassified Micromonospora]MCZ7475472.1 hypothetical protein [Micromonospora sp. WMMC273]
MRAANRRWGHVALTTCLLLAAAGCTSEDDAERPAPAAPDPSSPGAQAAPLPPLPEGGQRLRCADSIATTPEPGEGYRVVADTVAVSSTVVQPTGSSDDRGPTRLFAKWGLLVRAGAAVEVRVAPGWEDRARIGWGPGAVPATTVQVEACPAASASTAWSVYTGGTWVAGPACVPLVIKSPGRQVEVRLAIGAACDEST